MNLRVQGKLQNFTSLGEFQQRFDLPSSFRLDMLQPKQDRELGSIEQAGEALNEVRTRVIDVIPQDVAPTQWMTEVATLASTFEAELNRINAYVGLRPVEIDFAVEGFRGVCSAVAFAVVRAHTTRTEPPSFHEIYAEWLQDTVQISQEMHEYIYGDETWQLQIVSHAYGRVGLVVTTPHDVHYVVDKSLACPAEGYMARLLHDVAAQMMTSLR